ncbi:MAG: ABC transporter substrate-binding protein [Acidobacteriaceae bacterium]
MRGDASAKRIAAAGLLIAASLILVGGAPRIFAQNAKTSPAPYASIASDGESYAGPGRESSFDLTEQVLSIGLLVPLHGPEKADGDGIVAAAQMALKDASQRPMPGGRRLALAIGDESGPSWGLVSDVVMHLVFDQDAVALITSTSGDDGHLSEQVGNRIGVPVLTLSADATTTQIDIPWIFRPGPSDVLQAQAIARNIYRDRGLKSVLLVTERNHDGQRGDEAVRRAALSLGAPLPDGLVLDPLKPDLPSLLARMRSQPEQAVVLWTSAEVAGELLRLLDAAGVRAPIYLSQQAAQAGSRVVYLPANETAGAVYGAAVPEVKSAGIWTVSADGNDEAAALSFALRYRQLTGLLPSPAAAEAYDAVCLTVQALRAAGPNRARVRDKLAKVSDFRGASGTISFDREGNDSTPIHLVRVGRQGRSKATEEAAK